MKKVSNNPEKFFNVCKTQLSLARHFGGIKYNGDYYVYNPVDDTLTRDDVFKVENKRTKLRTPSKARLSMETKGEAANRLFGLDQ